MLLTRTCLVVCIRWPWPLTLTSVHWTLCIFKMWQTIMESFIKILYSIEGLWSKQKIDKQLYTYTYKPWNNIFAFLHTWVYKKNENSEHQNNTPIIYTRKYKNNAIKVKSTDKIVKKNTWYCTYWLTYLFF